MKKHTKIVATIGPASDSVKVIKELYEAGMNVARLNFSHGNQEYFRSIIRRIKKVSDEIAIMLDTRGPEIRTGEIEGGTLDLSGGDLITLTNKKVIGDKNKLTINYQKIGKLKVGHKLLIDDGLIAMQIISKRPDGLRAKVINGSVLGSNKTVCIQGHNVELPFLCDKDIKDIKFGLKVGVDFIAASFVRTKEDIQKLRKIIGKSKVMIISKIEHWKAVQNIDDIIDDSDGIMIARGDLGVEISLEKVPGIQAVVINQCNELGKPVIVATQMLESMKTNPRPTRAEVSDVAQAILQGTDAVMLSGETANGNYPVESVETMARIAKEYDRYVENNIDDLLDKTPKKDCIALFVTHAAHHASMELDTKAIITPTSSGFTARNVSRFKPRCRIIAPVFEKRILRQLQVSWGVTPIYTPKKYADAEKMIRESIKDSYKRKLVSKYDTVVVTAGMRLKKGHTNQLEVYVVKDVL